MPTRNVNLTEHFDHFVEDQIHSGKYQNASEVFRAGLKLLEKTEQEQELKQELLRQAIEAGVEDLQQGRVIDFNDESELKQSLEAKLAGLAKGS